MKRGVKPNATTPSVKPYTNVAAFRALDNIRIYHYHEVTSTHRPLSSSSLGLPCRILNFGAYG